MTHIERAARILKETEGVASLYGITSWEREFLLNVQKRERPLSEKQSKVLDQIEAKVFEEQDDDDDE